MDRRASRDRDFWRADCGPGSRSLVTRFQRDGHCGVEGGYVTFNDFEDDNQGLDVNAELDGFTLGINGRSNFAGPWYVSGRLGAFIWDAEADSVICPIAPPCVRIGADDDGTDFYAGAGVGYDFSEQVSLGIAYDYFGADADGANLDTDVFSVTGEIRF